jgi:hypothetical protein
LSVLLVVGFGASASAQEVTPACGPGELVAPDLATAVGRAAECRDQVEVESARTFTERQFAQPDGTVTLESHLTPQWARDGVGRWTEVDPTLRVDPAVGITTVATVVDIVVSPGGAGAFVQATSLSGGSISLIWPDPLPLPVLEGAVATYADVFDGVDLQVTAGADSFSYSLVVRSAQAARDPRLSRVQVEVQADGLQISVTDDGAVVARDPDGATVFSSAGAYMWDSSEPAPPIDPQVLNAPGGDLPGADPGRVAEVETGLDGNRLWIVPDQDMLSDPATEFPVTIDPTFTASKMAWAVVGDGQYADTTWWNDGAWPRAEGLRIGFQGWTAPGTEGYGRWRSMARFDTVALQGSTINSASVRLTVFHTGGCESYPLELWQVSAITQGAVPTSWNSTGSSWLRGGPLDTKVVASANGTGDWCAVMPERQVTFDGDNVRYWVQRHADVPFQSISFGLQAGDESDRMQWMRAYPESYALVVNYTPVTAVPSGLTTDGVGCLAPAGSRVTGSAPLLAGVPRDSEGTATARLELRAAGGTVNARSWLSPPGPSGEPFSWQVDQPLPDGVYWWRMRSESPSTGAASPWTTWCEFTVDMARDAEPEPEAAVMECPVPVVEGEPLEAAEESVALLLAQACGTPVEVTSERDFDVRVLAQADGTLLAEQFTQPQWAPDASGDWTEVNPSFEVAADGTISTAAAVTEIEVSDGGDGPLLTATDPDGDAVSLTWPAPLPQPVIDGTTVTYPEVLTGVDLQVSAGVDGFSYVLVVKDAEAAASPQLASLSVGIDAGDLQVVQDVGGGVVVQDPSGETVFSSPAAYMWDSSEPDESDALLFETGEEGSGEPGDVPPGRFTEMPIEVNGNTLTVEPDQTLLGDPGVEFPVLIDPPFSGRRMHWANVHQQQPSRGWTDDSRWPRAGGMRVGNLQWWPGFPCGDACGLWRSAIRFDIGKLGGKQIVSAAVKAVQTHTSGCGSYDLQLWYVTAFTSGTSWNGLSDNWSDHLQTQSVASSNRTGGCSSSTPARGVTFGGSAVRSRVQGHADAGHDSLSFGFRSGDEASPSAYRRIDVDSVKLEVVYNQAAQTPTNLNTDGKGCATSGPGPWLTTQRPTLSGVPRDPDGRVGAHLQIQRIGSSGTYYSWKSETNRQHNEVVNHRIPSSDRLPSGSYRWRMRSLDNHPQGTDSPWKEWCYFRVDVTSPTTPTVSIVGDPPAAGEQVTLQLRSSDAHSGLDGFLYGINEEVQRTFKASSGTTTITFTAATSGGRNFVYVWSRDKAENHSNRAVFDFFAARLVEATPVAAWRLDGDGLDDSGHGHDLMLGNGVTWENNGSPPSDRSLGFDGTGCVATDGPVVRTDAEYTIAAWVRLDENTRDHTVMATAGLVQSGFYLKYKASTGKWRVSLSSEDSRDNSWATAEATVAAVGQWTHLAVRVDPPARHIQMYVNGALSDEATIPFIPWNAENGALYLGCSSRLSGMTWDHFDGAIHHAGVWQGLLTPAQITAARNGELPAGLTGDWRLRGDGADGSAHARTVTVPPGAAWVDDQYGRQRSAMNVNGTAWAEASGPIARTDQSFSVAAWVKLNSKGTSRVVVSQAGTQLANFELAYHQPTDRWAMSMASLDGATATWHRAAGTTSPVVGEWYHLVGVYDRGTGQLRLFVNGQLQSSVAAAATPWRASGPLLIGASGNQSGQRTSPMVGTVSNVKTWRGALTANQAAEVHGGNPAVRELSRWSLNGHANDLVGSNSLTLVGTEGVDYQWVEDRTCFPFSALGLQMSGQGYAKTGGPVVTTDESFTITAWVKADSVTGAWQTFLAQRGSDLAAFYLQVSPGGGWRLSMAEKPTSPTLWAGAQTADGTVQVGAWTHLAGVFDLAKGEARLYLNGELAASGAGPQSPWNATASLYIGASGLQDGALYQPFHGTIDDVSAWSSTLDPDRILDMSNPPLFPGPCF